MIQNSPGSSRSCSPGSSVSVPGRTRFHRPVSNDETTRKCVRLGLPNKKHKHLVTCTFEPSNSIDEEDDPSSSWRSEPEGKKPEELASLEAPDDEEEWCWPKRNRITRWRKREEQRPIFHNLAEDGGEELASGSLTHLVQRIAGGAQWTWRKVTVVVVSGAAGEGNAEEHVSRNIHRGNGKIQE